MPPTDKVYVLLALMLWLVGSVTAGVVALLNALDAEPALSTWTV